MKTKEMKIMVCEMCSANNIIKSDGMYVCQNCGTKYTVEEAQKLLTEVAPKAAASAVNIPIDNELNNLYQAAVVVKEENKIREKKAAAKKKKKRRGFFMLFLVLLILSLIGTAAFSVKVYTARMQELLEESIDEAIVSGSTLTATDVQLINEVIANFDFPVSEKVENFQRDINMVVPYIGKWHYSSGDLALLNRFNNTSVTEFNFRFELWIFDDFEYKIDPDFYYYTQSKFDTSIIDRSIQNYDAYIIPCDEADDTMAFKFTATTFDYDKGSSFLISHINNNTMTIYYEVNGVVTTSVTLVKG